MGFDRLARTVGRAARSVTGDTISHTPQSGTATTGKRARFDRAYTPATPKGETEITETRPACWLWIADYATAPCPGDTITLTSTGTAYTIESLQPNGEGMKLAYLSEQ